MPLTDRQARFVREYLVDLNATQASIRAGYSAKTAEQQGPRLLGNVGVAAAIAEAQQRIAKKLDITAESVVNELAKLGFSNMEDYISTNGAGDPRVDLSAIDRDKWAAVQEVTIDEYTEGRGEKAREVKRIKFKLADKRAALVDIGRHLGLFKDRIEHSGDVNVMLKNASAEELLDRLAQLQRKTLARVTATDVEDQPP